MTNQTDKQDAPTVTNGVNVSALFETVDAVKQNPQIADFQFRASNQWVGADHNRTTISSFRGAFGTTLDCFFGAGGSDTFPVGLERFGDRASSFEHVAQLAVADGEIVLPACVSRIPRGQAFGNRHTGARIESVKRLQGDMSAADPRRGKLGPIGYDNQHR